LNAAISGAVGDQMGLIDTIDLNVLRNPLSGDDPAGANLDEPGVARTRWRKVTDAFREARLIERKVAQGVVGQLSSSGDVVSNESPATIAEALTNWRTVANESLEILASVCRDLRVAQYLIMALVRTDGFAGMAAGCDVARTLVETQWPALGPRPEPDEASASPEDLRVQPLVDLAGGEQVGMLEEPLKNVPLLDGCNWGRFGLVVLPGGGAPNGVAAEDFAGLRAGTSRDFFMALHAQAAAADAAWKKLAEAVDVAAEGRVSLPRDMIESVLHDCRSAIASLAGESFAESAHDAAGSSDGESGGDSFGGNGDSSRGGLAARPKTREDVLQSLAEAADFFSRQDPHSLVAAQLKNIVRMARLPQVDYFRELIRDKQTLEQLSRMVGLDFGDSGDSGSA